MGAILIPILERRKLRLKEVRSSTKVTQPVRNGARFLNPELSPLTTATHRRFSLCEATAK